MPSTLAESSVWGSTVTIPSAADAQSAASVNTPIGTLANRTQFLRDAGWLSSEITLAGDIHSAQITGSAWTAGTLSVSGPLLRTWLSASAVVNTGRLIVSAPHAVMAGLYLSGLTVISRHAGTPHAGLPGVACVVELYTVGGAGAPAAVGAYPIADTASFTAYDALQAYRISIGTGLRPQLNGTAPLQAAFNNESGVDAQTGREIRGLLWHFTRTA